MMGISAALIAALEHATGARHTLFGKPSVAGVHMVSALTGAAPQEMVVLGDDPNLELRMARRAGALAGGVLTGTGDRAAFAADQPEERAHPELDTLEHFTLDLAVTTG
ncbi:HAD hydrolase-like protein [Mesobacterium pallidum]|uniref:HAD hydrolase-like protein n=1 Tax=Mesobacterium pallidum TaxID=2872037 RepID=UPI001EE317EA|nr:HAD hydrolase-like protein [Mesobacterium pallidum]